MIKSFLVSVFAVLLLIAPASAEVICNTQIQPTNVRKGPSAKTFEKIATLMNGTLVEIVNRVTNSEGYDWVKVIFKDEQGEERVGFISSGAIAKQCDSPPNKTKGKSVEWFKETTEKAMAGNEVSQVSLGLAYLEGDGTQKNKVLALMWFKKAAEKGNPDLQFIVGKMLVDGIGEDNPAAGYEWIKKAAAQGHERAKGVVAEVEKQRAQNENEIAAKNKAAEQADAQNSQQQYQPKYGCEFVCEGQYGFARTKKIRVNTPATNISEAQSFVKKEYKSQCEQFPFYPNGGSKANVGFPNCATWFYEN